MSLIALASQQGPLHTQSHKSHSLVIGAVIEGREGGRGRSILGPESGGHGRVKEVSSGR